MRFLVAALAIWLLLFLNIERLSGPIGITTITYASVPMLAAVIVVVPRLHRVPLWALLVVFEPLFLALKVWAGYPLAGSVATVSTVMEVCAMGITAALAWRLMAEVSEVENAIAHICIRQDRKLPQPFVSGQGAIYREVRRARNYHRPLALMAIGVEEKTIDVAIDRLVQEIQRATMKQCVLSSVSKSLLDVLEDCNVVARMNDHFLVLLPEVTPDQLPDLASHLRQVVADQVGVALRIGTAALPRDTLTFEGMMQRAIREMNGASARFAPTDTLESTYTPPGPLSQEIHGSVSQEPMDAISDNQPA